MIWAIVPAFNEEKKIGRVISGLFEHGAEKIIVVDDGSNDKTAENARAAGAIVLSHKINRGQGAALQTGDEYAFLNGAEYAVHFDGDGQFNPADIIPAVDFLRKNNLDIVLGSRFLDGRSCLPFLKRYFVLPVARLVNYFLTGLKLSDAHNGFRVLSRRALAELKITRDGMAHNSEIVALIKEKKLEFAEFPVEVRYFEYGQGTKEGIKIVLDIFMAKIIGK
ncbi:MAG: glycosyltransferase family 2 protein [Patescibacteria group bacterium]|jgi:glycosyltransferase involved in cell wall biosynthesis|nr:glycosyltransferase family 2 protein [Patescibacteria group bacterium]